MGEACRDASSSLEHSIPQEVIHVDVQVDLTKDDAMTAKGEGGLGQTAPPLSCQWAEHLPIGEEEPKHIQGEEVLIVEILFLVEGTEALTEDVANQVKDIKGLAC